MLAGSDQIFGQGGAFEKAERRTGMQFDEHRPWLEGELFVSLFIRLYSGGAGADCQGKLTKNRELEADYWDYLIWVI